MGLRMKFTIGKDKDLEPKVISEAFDFAERLWIEEAQSKKNFGNMDREHAHFIASNVEGKLAEEGLALFLKHNFEVIMKPDYNIYPGKYEIDYGNDIQDFEIPSGSKFIGTFKVDVKGSQDTSQWLLVEKHKFWANAYVFITVGGLNNDWIYNPLSSKENELTLTIAGFSYYTDIIDVETKKPWFMYLNGEQLVKIKQVNDMVKTLGEASKLIPDETRTHLLDLMKNKDNVYNHPPLKAKENFGLPKKWLRNSEDEWAELTKLIKLCCFGPENNLMNRIAPKSIIADANSNSDSFWEKAPEFDVLVDWSNEVNFDEIEKPFEICNNCGKVEIKHTFSEGGGLCIECSELDIFELCPGCSNFFPIGTLNGGKCRTCDQ